MRITAKRGKNIIIWEPHQITIKVGARKSGDAKC